MGKILSFTVDQAHQLPTFYSAISLWSAMKKKPLCTIHLAHGSGENKVANWITAIAVVVNTDLVATGG